VPYPPIWTDAYFSADREDGRPDPPIWTASGTLPLSRWHAHIRAFWMLCDERHPELTPVIRLSTRANGQSERSVEPFARHHRGTGQVPGLVLLCPLPSCALSPRCQIGLFLDQERRDARPGSAFEGLAGRASAFTVTSPPRTTFTWHASQRSTTVLPRRPLSSSGPRRLGGAQPAGLSQTIGAGGVLSPRNWGEEANFDSSPFFDDRAAFGQFHGFGELAGREECVTAERQWRSARADGCPLEDCVAGVHQVGAEPAEPGFPGGRGVGGADVVLRVAVNKQVGIHLSALLRMLGYRPL